MRYRLLGKSGLRVSELCLGTMTFMEGLGWGASKRESQAIFDAFMEAGGNFIDTASSYGTSEEYLSEFMAGDRERVVLGTKYTGRLVGGNLQPDANAAGNHRKSMAQAVERSLRRLKTDYIDLLWVHSWDFMTPVEEVMRSLDDLVRRGKVLYVGISNAPAWVVAQANTLSELRGWTPFVGMQIQYNLLERTAERELLPAARALDIGATAWTPLASGWLTGKYARPQPTRPGDRRLDDPIASAFVPRSERNLAIAEEVVKIATEVGCVPAHVALNWLRQRGVIPVMGARNAEQVKENLGCLGSGLSEGQTRRLDEISKVQLGFPHDFLATGMVRHHVYGGMFDLIDNHRDYSFPARAAGPPASPKRGADFTNLTDSVEEFVN